MRSHSPRVILAALAVATVLVAGAKCQPASDSPPATGASGPAATGNAGSAGNPAAAKQNLAGLTVADQASMSGYSRDHFPHWISQGGGCDTRDVVLKRDGKDVKATADCKITSGSWFSPYDKKSFTDPQQLDIDHLVPLAAAWRAGANKWTDQHRSEFANDLTRPQLFAVSLTSNRSKGDQDPSTWKPPSRDYWCTYASNWVTVKAYYGLTVTAAEKAALGDMLGTCT